MHLMALQRALWTTSSVDFAAMQGWAITAVRRGKPAMASGGGWVWRCSAFPHDDSGPSFPVMMSSPWQPSSKTDMHIGWVDR